MMAQFAALESDGKGPKRRLTEQPLQLRPDEFDFHNRYS